MNYNVQVSDEAFMHLAPQRGALWAMRNEREEWLMAYQRQLGDTFRAIYDHVPAHPAKPRILDIGAGMGGIDLYLWRRYGAGTLLSLLDHIGGRPEPVYHDEPFGDLNVSRRFLEANGVAREDIVILGPGIRGVPPHPPLPMFDIIISTQAWCFHIEPAEYLDWVVSRLTPGAVVIVDVRHGRDEWLTQLESALGPVRAIAARQRKCDMLVFRP